MESHLIQITHAFRGSFHVLSIHLYIYIQELFVSWLFKSSANIKHKAELQPVLLISCLTYDDGAGAQQPDLLLQSHPVGDLLLLLAVCHRAAVLSIHVRLPGSAPVRPVRCVLPVPVLSSLRIHAD